MPIPSDVLEATTMAPVEPPLGSGPIVVATDGDPDSDAALGSAWSLVGRTGANVQVLSVVAPIAPVVEFAVKTLLPADFWQDRREAQLDAVREQQHRTLPRECEWPISVIEGDGGDAIARFAREQCGRLVVMGRGRHGLAHRLVAPEAVLRVLQFSDVPVLAVEQNATALAQRVVVATDFSPYSTYAARLALSLAAPDATVYLVHVRPPTKVAGPAGARRERGYLEALPAMFTRVREHVSPAIGLQVETVLLVGDPGQALIDFATSSRADLVVSATHGYGFINRVALGSVALDLLRGAPCSLLCVPASTVTHAAARKEATEHFLRNSIPMAELSRELAEFSRRNGGRLCAIELVPPGAERQVLASAVPLLGADFESEDSDVTLLFGAAGREEAHLTHLVRDVRGVDRLIDSQGVDCGLAIVSGAATTWLRMLP